ncbi:hypothetical protein OPV22_005002 [Ensete ventricosum]|uniref:BSD domain-containing protein n=1 Tax=Ensete ventricosum TaxID=4639 RepID=A0AAV8Q1H7_ENSVE|nr:hypothetical protein OPV22_005002 [Ensete ventricosum]
MQTLSLVFIVDLICCLPEENCCYTGGATMNTEEELMPVFRQKLLFLPGEEEVDLWLQYFKLIASGNGRSGGGEAAPSITQKRVLFVFEFVLRRTFFLILAQNPHLDPSRSLPDWRRKSGCIRKKRHRGKVKKTSSFS